MISARTIILFVIFGFALVALANLSPSRMHHITWPDSIQFGRDCSRSTIQLLVLIYVAVASITPACSYAFDKGKLDRKRAFKSAVIFMGLVLFAFFSCLPSVQ